MFDLLRRYESRNVTFIEPDGSWPIVWKRAKGVHVWDEAGRRYLDLTAAFGVAAAGHANPRVVLAGQRQMGELLHAMGDVHPHRLKAELARELSRLTFERWSGDFGAGAVSGKTLFCNSGFEAVEAALKTGMLATGRSGVVAFHGAYHGLGYGALNVTHRSHFRGHFVEQLGGFGCFVPFPRSSEDLPPIEVQIKRLLRSKRIGAILVEPVQGRGGVNIPPVKFLPMLRKLCDEAKALLIVDEVFTGFGRTGKWFACEHSGTMPDIVCLGKALTGGFPLAACVGTAEIMDHAWPQSTGEAIHTSTYLGHPVGCAMALAQIKEIRRLKLPERSARLGRWLGDELSRLPSRKGIRLESRCLGLMAGVELTTKNGEAGTALSLKLMKEMLRKGILVLPEGEHSNVISLIPPLTVTRVQLAKAAEALAESLSDPACLAQSGGKGWLDPQ